MDPVSRHLLVEYHGCDPVLLDDASHIEALMRTAATAARVVVVRSVFHRYAPHGITGVVVIEESHLSVHTWPEHGFAAVDFYTCGGGWPEACVDVLRDGLRASRTEVMLIERGLDPPQPSMRIRTHYVAQGGVEQVLTAKDER